MSKIQPETITHQLIDRANAMLAAWPPNDFAIRALKREAEKLRNVSFVDYKMLLGMCATMERDVDALRTHFSSAIQSSGGDLNPVLNYARSLQALNYFDEACQLLRSFSGRYADDLEYCRVFLEALRVAGRFHEAARFYENTKRLGESAENVIQTYKVLPPLSQLVHGIADDPIAAAVDTFSQYLRDIGAIKIWIGNSPLDEEDTGQDRTGIEITYGMPESNAARVAELDFGGSLFVANNHLELVEKGILVFTIRVGSTSADQAA